MLEGKPLIGVVHLPPLPGSPGYSGNFEDIVERAIRDARAYYENGVRHILAENYGDKPFRVRVREPETIAAMAVVVREVVRELSDDAVVGISLLRNSGPEAVAIAAVAGARFVRVNALCQTIEAPEGILYPVAREVAEVYHRLRIPRDRVLVLADVNVKHGSPLGSRSLEEVIVDTVERGGAYAVIITGSRTGAPPEPELVARAKRTGARVFVGSGVDPERLKAYWRFADGFIVGTYFKRDHITTNPVDPENVRRMVAVYRELMKAEGER